MRNPSNNPQCQILSESSNTKFFENETISPRKRLLDNFHNFFIEKRKYADLRVENSRKYANRNYNRWSHVPSYFAHVTQCCREEKIQGSLGISTAIPSYV